MPHADPCTAELVSLVSRFAAGDGVHATAIPALHLIRANAPAQRLPAVYEPGLVLVVQGRKQAMLGHELLSYDPLHCLVISVTMLPLAQVIEASVARPYLCLRLSVDRHELATLLRDVPEGPAAAPAHGPRGLNVARVSPPLLDAVLRLVRLLDTPRDAPVLAPLLQREIFYRVLTGELGPRLRALSTADSHAQRIGHAIDLLKRRFAEPVRLEEVAQAAAMSPSSLHLHFKQVTSMSPLQYQKLLRLHHARQLMLADGIDAASAGHRVGYESPSQFSREYRRLFGAPPRADAAGVRRAMVGDPGA
ncbi:MAG: AraC family transcriptional regulator [Burkholderiales bacterium]|nr:AraC family transcriptional regulator [Burkholderiales bacterium]